MSHRGLIALDCDGVLLDYHAAYRDAWGRAYGTRPRLKNPHAYQAYDRWDVPKLEGTALQHFKGTLETGFWDSMPALPGAREACQRLADEGYTLICVTALDTPLLPQRERNLQATGFTMLSEVIATGKPVTKKDNPKATFLQALRPRVFVDDYPVYFSGLPAETHAALISEVPEGLSSEYAAQIHSIHKDLESFARWWVTLTTEPVF